MRTRKEIESGHTYYSDSARILEVLLDIRDLLAHPIRAYEEPSTDKN